ncbi:MAG TPA: acyl-protein synthetase [Verrucomicrobiae bacterium]|nr:acyl-protein synthetase [Verrucomicrobiae bacterium]
MTIEERINGLLTGSPYALEPKQRDAALLDLLKEELAGACEQNARFGNYVAHWPTDFRTASRIADLPFLPTGIFKSNPPLALVEAGEVTRVLASSSTTGQTPSRVALDAATAKRMSKGAMAIFRDFLGSARRPYLVIDTTETLSGRQELGARGAAVQSLRAFATEIVCCLRPAQTGNLEIDLEKLLECAAKWKDAEVLVYGFTYVIWNSFVQPLKTRGIRLPLPKVHILHSGGWKRLEKQSVTREVFAEGVASVFGASPGRVIDFYGMVENVGVVYPDCEQGNKHVPAFADVVVRNPLTLEPVAAGEQGLVQVCSVLPTSFPGFLVLTEDIAKIIGYDGCPCGRRGTYFRFIGRAPKAEVRGCGNVETSRGRRDVEMAAYE